jgi:hypothetical protein
MRISAPTVIGAVRLLFFWILALAASVAFDSPASAKADPLPSWSDGPTKQAIVAFVHSATDPTSPTFVPPEERIATFDQDGTLWVSHPIYTQVVYCLERVPAVVKAKPELANVESFKTVLSGNRLQDCRRRTSRRSQPPRSLA